MHKSKKFKISRLCKEKKEMITRMTRWLWAKKQRKTQKKIAVHNRGVFKKVEISNCKAKYRNRKDW